MSIANLTEAVIRKNSSSQSFQRGLDYYRIDAVESLVRRGNMIQAVIEGTEPYEVTVVLDSPGGIEADCSCPYEYDGWCKHIVAALLACVRKPEVIEEQAPLRELLEPLNREQLIALVVQLAERDFDLADDIAAQVASIAVTAKAGAGESPGVSVDAAAYQRQVRTALHGLDHRRASEAYWHTADVVKSVSNVLQPARDLIAAGDGQSALKILEAVTEEYMESWTMYDDSDGDFSAFFQELGPLWAEAILSADLTKAQRESLADKLDGWDDEVGDYGVDDAFEVAVEAARQGWDYLPLVQVLQGKRKRSIWQEEDAWHADDLTQARLRVLERRQRFDEYLRLAAVEEQHESHAVMLAKLGRAEEAVKYALKNLHAPAEFLHLAQTLQSKDFIAEALRIAEHGVSLPNPNENLEWDIGVRSGKAELASWLRDAAEAQGQDQLALRAARIAVVGAPDLQAYLKTQSLAGKKWKSIREELLSEIRKSKTSDKEGLADQKNVGDYWQLTLSEK